ncbi:hypothetical protein H6G17_13100 [Chroococcidiopsis sp. FACHB-1243]|nr:hypothetical protein [Chroococcidiopsis sp. [FACHB-1243]]MBD2306446.1 hypothetical protein [Chroococcidiopsis sp. [FACHB-1243]]
MAEIFSPAIKFRDRHNFYQMVEEGGDWRSPQFFFSYGFMRCNSPTAEIW